MKWKNQYLSRKILKKKVSKTQKETKIKIIIVNDKNDENKDKDSKNIEESQNDDMEVEKVVKEEVIEDKLEEGQNEINEQIKEDEESDKENDDLNINNIDSNKVESQEDPKSTIKSEDQSKKSTSTTITETTQNPDTNLNTSTTSTKNTTNKRDKRKKKNVNDSVLKVNEERKKRIKLVVKVIDEVPLEKFIETLGVNLDFNNTIDNNFPLKNDVKSVTAISEKQKTGNDKEFVFDVMKFDSNIMKKLNDLVK